MDRNILKTRNHTATNIVPNSGKHTQDLTGNTSTDKTLKDFFLADNSPKRPHRDDYKWSVFPELVNKPKNGINGDGKKLSHTAYTKLRPFSGSVEDLFSFVIGKGNAISPFIFRNNKRVQNNAELASFLVLDIDNGLTIQDALKNEFIAKYGAIYTTPSHSDSHHKFRILIPLPCEVDIETYEVLVNTVNDILGGVNDSCTNEPARLFYGNNEAKTFNFENFSPLPYPLITEAMEVAKGEKEKAEKEKAKRLEKRKEIVANTDINGLFDYAIALIPELPPRQKGSNQYEYLLGITWGYCALFTQAGRSLDELKDLLEASPMASDRSQGWNISRIINDYDSERLGTDEKAITPSSIFHNLNEVFGTDKYTLNASQYLGEIKLSKEDKKRYKERRKARNKKILNGFNTFSYDLDLNQRYLIEKSFNNNPVLDNAIENNTLIIIKSAMNTGKSFYLKRLVEKAKKEGKRVFIIGSRRLLTFSLANDCQLPAITDIDQEINQLSSISLDAKINGIYGGLGIVIDSLAKLKNVDFSNSLVIIDECSQLTDHALNSNTAIKDNRGYILKLLEEKLKQATSSGGKVLGFDANASNLDADWLTSVCGVEKAFKIQNQFKPEKSPIKLYSLDSVEGSKAKKNLEDSYFNQLFGDIRRGEPIILSSDNKTELQALMERIKKEFPKLKTITIDADTVSTKDSFERKLLTGNFEGDMTRDEIIKSENFQIFAYSPVMQSGISIDNPTINDDGELSYDSAHFPKKYVIATKVVQPSILRQLINRGRSPIECHLLLKGQANYQNNFDWEEILENNTAEYVKEKIDLLKQVREKVGIQEIIEFLQNSEQKDNHLTDIHSVTKAKLEAKRNLEMSMYQDVLIDELKDDGHEVKLIGLPEIEPESNFDSKEAKEEILREKAIAIDKADDIPIETARKLNKKELSTTQQNQVSKAILKDSFPFISIGDGQGVDFIYDFVLKDRYKTLNAIKKYWWSQNPELAFKHDTKEFIYALQQAQKSNYFWLGDIKPVTPYTDLYEALNLQSLIDYGKPISNNCDIVKRFRKLCEEKDNKDLLKKLNIKFSKSMQNIQLLRKVLDLFGFKTGKAERIRVNGQKIRFYPILKSIDTTLWDNLIECYNWQGAKMPDIDWSIFAEDDGFYDHTLGSREFSEKKATQTQAQHGLQSGPPPSVYSYNKPERGGPPTTPYTESNQHGCNEITYKKADSEVKSTNITDHKTGNFRNATPSGEREKVTNTTEKDDRLGRKYQFIPPVSFEFDWDNLPIGKLEKIEGGTFWVNYDGRLFACGENQIEFENARSNLS